MKLLLLLTLFAHAADFKTDWTSQWNRNDLHSPSTLVIKDVTEKGFNYELSASAGMNVGEAAGVAEFGTDKRHAKAKFEGCEFAFLIPIEMGHDSKVPVTLIRVSTNGNCDQIGGQGVDFDGDYLKDGMKPTFQTSFPCGETDNKVEIAICTDELLAKADLDLSAVYDKLEPSAPLKKEQIAWLKRRNKECKKSGARCLAKHYAQRLYELREIAKGRKPGAKVSFRFTDYVKKDLNASRDELFNDVLVKLHLRDKLSDADYDWFSRHNIYFLEGETKVGKEIGVLANIKGGPDKAGVVLTDKSELWVLLPSGIYAPSGSKSSPPELVGEWEETAAKKTKVKRIL